MLLKLVIIFSHHLILQRVSCPVKLDHLNPAWSPDGGKIVFERVGAVGTDVYVMNADGSNQIRLTTAVASVEQNTAPEWSPDGSKIVFNSNRAATGGDLEIYVMSADGSNQTALTDNTFIDNVPDWSPDGSKIAFQTNRNGNFDVYTMNTDGSSQTRITTQAGNDFQVSWSPDAAKFVFVTDRDGNQEIYTMNADGGNQVRLTSNTVTDTAPNWKPRRAAVPRAVLYDYFGTGRSNYLSFDYNTSALGWDILRNPVKSPPQILHASFGLSESDIQMFGDYDGDLKMDLAVWRPGTSANPQSYFYVQRSSDPNPNSLYSQPWGLPSDFPAVGDFDGDGKDDFTVARKENGKLAWYILPGGGNFRRIEFGLATDAALTDSRSDFNNDGREDLLVARSDAATGNITFFAGDALTGQIVLAQQWGNVRAAGEDATVFLFYGNYLGDSRADVGVYYGVCPTNPTCEIGGSWWFKETGSANYTATKFGIPLNFQANTGDFPVGGDFDGDGRQDITVLRQSNTTYYSLLSGSGQIKSQFWDGNWVVPPSSSQSLLKNPIETRGKLIPAGALKGLVITAQSDGTYRTARMIDRLLKNK